ncbi:DUF1684 domain-containing protein [Flavobacterium taihuense]|uniref:DUF1684 domain-containing protein n=1 Tax=Flavobacterium taihuense TaxID=2857508 RepID=A0ABS6XXZ5_9FLAO|nr:DUF1684 domain-containing protein [Flavobacterium taihuense]MBW4361544.1 DUF1684 domain-containing protein [Flavobacterium taihuense]
MRIILALVLLASFNVGFTQEKFDTAVVEKFQKDLNAEYADAKTSPLLPEDLAHFKSLDFYPINEKAFAFAQFIRTEDEKPFEMPTSTARKPLYVKYGEARFQLEGREFKLNIYRNIELSKKEEYKDYMFLPFSDLTSGKESYIGGKYIDLKIPSGNTIIIDFNLSYNPYCAYSHKYSCPKVPLENDLAIEIKAGVKKFHD